LEKQAFNKVANLKIDKQIKIINQDYDNQVNQKNEYQIENNCKNNYETEDLELIQFKNEIMKLKAQNESLMQTLKKQGQDNTKLGSVLSK